MRTLALLRMMILVVSVGWLFVWVMLPTKTYKNSWTPTLNSHLNSTYFAEQGTNLLLFVFPIMLIAALGCVYLHMKTNNVTTSNHHLAALKRPVLVMSTFGIINVVELTFAAMFVVLSIWSLSNYLHISFGHLHMHKEGEKVWEAKFRSVFLRLGYIGNICWAFLFFPVTRSSSILPIFGLTTESSMKYHIWLGHLSMILFTAHSIGFIIYWGFTNQMALMLEWSRTYVSNVAGEIAFVVSLVMWATTFHRIRRKMFELFFYTHHLYTVYLVFYILHVGVAYFCTILPGIFLFLIDRYLRFLQSRQRVRLISARLLPCATIELNFSKTLGLNYNPDSMLYVNVPSVSKLQWHPFTVTSNCNMEPDKLSIVIKSAGSWSQNLYQGLSSPIDRLLVSVDGPYGPTSSNFLRHDLIVMISGGSGITPFISIIREHIFQSTKPNNKIPKLLLVCAFKNSADLKMLDLLLPISNPTTNNITKLNLQIEAYITREQTQPLEPTQPVQTIWFKPTPSDSLISSPLGPNGWLWLGAIISSSFIMFLLLLAFITRYHIHGDDQESELVYHYSLKTIWDMFFVCASVFVVTSGVFIWQKKKEGMEGRQIQSFEMETPATSPGLGFKCGDREIDESLPKHCLTETTKLHFGGRPDLQKILMESKGSGTDVGVFACGPKKMRHEVAKICSSGLVPNLHFESISFNW